MTDIPTCRWGILTTGLISSWFIADIVLQRSDAKAKHVIQSIGTSSLQKGKDFAAKYCPDATPTIYASYEEVYADPNVDCVYIGTPHAFHKKNCLDAIAAGKNVLCEKAFTINAAEAREVIDAAQKKGVYIAEAMWLRHRPMVAELRDVLYKQKAIGEVSILTSQFPLPMDIANLPPTSRYKDPNLGAGSLLDIGIYSLTWAFLALDPHEPHDAERPKILATQTHAHGVEVATSIILQYPSTGKQAVLTSTFLTDPVSETVCRIQGSAGYVDVSGSRPSHPEYFTVYVKDGANSWKAEKHEFCQPGQGFTFEADNTALDIAAGRKESPIVPWKATIRVMQVMDEIRRQGGTVYAQDTK